MRRGLHIGLGIAQVSEDRQVVLSEETFEFRRCTGAGIDAHADHGDEGLVLAHDFLGEQGFKKLARRQDIEQGRLHRHDDPAHGFEHTIKQLAVQAGGGIEDDVRGAGRRTRRLPVADIPTGDRRHGSGAHPEPGTRRLLAIHVTEHHLSALMREIASEVGGQRGFAGPSFGIGDQDGFHSLLSELSLHPR